jgi:hypothetical protein
MRSISPRTSTANVARRGPIDLAPFIMRAPDLLPRILSTINIFIVMHQQMSYTITHSITKGDTA